MTKQEALQELMNLSIDYGTRTADEIERLDEAVDMAIKALKADALERQTCDDDPRADVYYLAEKIGINRLYALVVELRGEPESCDDAVSRQAAIDAVKKNTFRLTFAEEQGCEGHVAWSAEAVYSDVIEGALLELPSAQSHDIARDIATIIENEKDMRVILKNAQPDTPDTNGGDIIYRQAAIDALESIGSLDTEADKKYARSVFEALPSVQPETHDKHTETHACDCISRQAAIELAMQYCPDDDGSCSKADRDIRELLDDLENLPSVQPEPIHINLNEPIKVKLTDWGKEIYYHQYDRTNQIAGREICKPRFPREDENGYTEFQLWCFIELYGMHMGMTLPNVIEPLEIVYER